MATVKEMLKTDGESVMYDKKNYQKILDVNQFDGRVDQKSNLMEEVWNKRHSVYGAVHAAKTERSNLRHTSGIDDTYEREFEFARLNLHSENNPRLTKPNFGLIVQDYRKVFYSSFTKPKGPCGLQESVDTSLERKG
jgi:hypothetical protein